MEEHHLGNLSVAHAELGDARSAFGFHDYALAIAREIGDRLMEGNSLGNLGSAHARLGLGLALFAAGDAEGAARELGTVRRMRETGIFPPADEPPASTPSPRSTWPRGTSPRPFAMSSGPSRSSASPAFLGVDTLGESLRIRAEIERRAGNADGPAPRPRELGLNRRAPAPARRGAVLHR